MGAVVTEKAPEVTLEFEDLIPGHNVGTAYVVPNEEVEIWRNFVVDLSVKTRFNRVGAICSGGEVGFLALLPSVREELILIDHNYHSMRYAMQKYLLMKKHGFKRCRELFKDTDKETFIATVKELDSCLPKAILDSMTAQRRSYDHLDDHAVKAYERIAYACDNGDGYTRGSSMGELWNIASTYRQRQCFSKLDKVKFIHGDFVTIADRGPFDLFYISNASQSGNGNQRNKTVAEISALVRDGGYVLSSIKYNEPEVYQRFTGRYDPLTKKPIYEPYIREGDLVRPEHWKLVKSERGSKSAWDYCVYQVNHTQEKAA